MCARPRSRPPDSPCGCTPPTAGSSRRLVPVDGDAVCRSDRARCPVPRGTARSDLPSAPANAIADQVVRVVLVLPDVVPEAAANALAARVEQIGPRVLPTEQSDRPPSSRPSVPNVMPLPENPVPTNWRSAVSPMIRQSVRRLDDLSRPPMRDLDAADHRAQRPLEPLEAGLRVGRLTGLVIFAAEDHEVVIAMRLDAEVVIRIGGVPEQRVGNRALLDARRRPRSWCRARAWSGTAWRWPCWRCQPGACAWRARRTRR